MWTPGVSPGSVRRLRAWSSTTFSTVCLRDLPVDGEVDSPTQVEGLFADFGCESAVEARRLDFKVGDGVQHVVENVTGRCHALASGFSGPLGDRHQQERHRPPRLWASWAPHSVHLEYGLPDDLALSRRLWRRHSSEQNRWVLVRLLNFWPQLAHGMGSASE